MASVSEAIVDEKVCQRMIEVGVVAVDAVVLVRVGLLPEKDVLLFQRCAQEHRLLVVDIVIL
jgi:hypothetical protein